VDNLATVSPRSVSQAVLLVTLPSMSSRVIVMLCRVAMSSSSVKGVAGLLDDMVVECGAWGGVGAVAGFRRRLGFGQGSRRGDGRLLVAQGSGSGCL
jgi:hypothetical protein